MTKYVVEFESFERHVVEGKVEQFACIKYLLAKYKPEFPDYMCHTYPLPENTDEEITWSKATHLPR